ncbi:MAG: YncE family protein [Acidimicrobiales bacterium]
MAALLPSDPRRRTRLVAAVAALGAATAVAGCASLATPQTVPDPDASQAPAGLVGYVVCPDAVTPVELSTRTPEAAIPLPVSGTPALGDFAIATSPDGRWAYVVTGDSAGPRAIASTGGSGTSTTGGVDGQNVVIPVDLVTQQAGRPIRIPGRGATHAIVVLPGGRSVLASSGSTVVPVDVASGLVGAPIDLGPGHTVFGMALDPVGTTVYVLVSGGVVPVDTASGTAGAELLTGLAVSSVYSPHGIVVSADGAMVYVVGQGGPNFGGRVLPIVTATRTTLPPASFDRYGIADPAAVALAPDGSSLLVVDAANDWVNPMPLATFLDPPFPVPLPSREAGVSTTTRHPTDVVFAPGGDEAFIVDGFDSVIPFASSTSTFGRPVPVCTGASSMAVAPAP